MKLPKWIRWSKTEGKYELKYTDEDMQKFYKALETSDEVRRKLKSLYYVGMDLKALNGRASRNALSRKEFLQIFESNIYS